MQIIAGKTSSVKLSYMRASFHEPFHALMTARLHGRAHLGPFVNLSDKDPFRSRSFGKSGNPPATRRLTQSFCGVTTTRKNLSCKQVMNLL